MSENWGKYQHQAKEMNEKPKLNTAPACECCVQLTSLTLTPHISVSFPTEIAFTYFIEKGRK